ncbi:hypothetical protein ACFPYJ_15130 [Paenibacillus solisilvae]|uniref:DUF4309 domain-containing protein n=1 Tax=Paenibacillus solisilvae TaxID=2486751 RepID=A0ABW0VX17_9BACL
MKPLPVKPLRYAIITAAAVMISGCQISLPYSNAENSTYQPKPNQATAVSDHVSNSPQKSFDNKDSIGGEVPVVNAVADDTKASAPDAQTESTTAANKTPSSQAAKEEKQWDSKAPKLHGIAIDDSKAIIETKLGKPSDSYTYDDEDETLTINEYVTFSVGFGKNKKVKFIEVFDRKCVTDLNGLRVGDNETAAVKALGKPDTHTTSVLTYQATNSLLKLDLDPDNNEIISIKLFLNSEKP